MAQVRHEPALPRRADPRFRALYQGHFGLVWSLTAHFGVPAAAREDVAQEVWLTVHRRIDALRPDASSRAWLAAIARHVASRHHRSQTRHARRRAALSVHLESIATRPSEPDAFATVDAALARMDAGQREVFLLMQVEELSGPECSEALGLPLNTVYSRLRLARARLTEAMGELDLDAAAATMRCAPPPRAATQRLWLALGLDLFDRHGTATTIASTWTGKLAVAATAALATVVGTAALAGRGDAAAHARHRAHEDGAPPIHVAAVVDPAGAPAPAPRSAEPPTVVDAAPRLVAATRADTFDTPRLAPDEPRRRAPAGAPRLRRGGPPRAAAPNDERDDGGPPSAATTTTSTLAAEAKLLRGASVALRDHDPALARRLLEAHAHEYPEGALAIDRRAAWARMLCASGAIDDARALAKRLVAEHPASPTAAAVRDVCSAAARKP
ncbi:MAG: sigma-70 family RNA polymerase sigma factor [Deltaproteobacteria bacterium]|nr:sigma-70 family RNA polymerase sigma factor [Deltaproteobacteria bacterium]